MGDRAYAKWQINNNGNKKICAFSEDEKQLLVVTQDGSYYKMAVQPGEHPDPKNAAIPLFKKE